MSGSDGSADYACEAADACLADTGPAPAAEAPPFVLEMHQLGGDCDRPWLPRLRWSSNALLAMVSANTETGDDYSTLVEGYVEHDDALNLLDELGRVMGIGTYLDEVGVTADLPHARPAGIDDSPYVRDDG